MYSFFFEPKIFFSDVMGMPSIANAADDLLIDKKTFRKLLKGQKTSCQTEQKIKDYAESELKITTKDSEQSWLEGDRNLLKHGQWKGFLLGIRHSNKDKKSFFLEHRPC